ncbi:uncharacterized protein LOC134092340 [Sardina pilchardus]|uniref:uncharacterized protein LOC134092340 n=1 Tax=Sardina pilchardus TaxID=27697 RepID=UPI002E15F035
MGFTSVPPTTSRTSLPQAWHVPSRSLGVTPRAVSTVSVSKLKPPLMNAPPQKKQRSAEGLMSNLYCPVPFPLPAEELAEMLYRNLDTIGSKSQMFKLLEANRKQPVPSVSTHFGDLPRGSVCSYQNHTSLSVSLDDDDPPLPFSPQPCSFSTVLDETEACYYGGLAVTRFDAEQLERDTRGQSLSKTWHQVRVKRLTSTSFKRICSRVKEFESLATNLMERKSVQTKAMKRGLEMEPVAAVEYSALSGNDIYPCGLVINPHAPHLGASPDRKVCDLSATPTHGLLEIKCPDKESISECGYLLCQADGKFTLKTSHEYYFQMVGQMGVTGMVWCDFFVKCRQDYHLERIHFNPSEWESMKAKLDMFFFSYFLPALCHKSQHNH